MKRFKVRVNHFGRHIQDKYGIAWRTLDDFNWDRYYTGNTENNHLSLLVL